MLVFCLLWILLLLQLTDADFSSAKVQIQDTTVNLTNIELLYWTRGSDQVKFHILVPTVIS